MTIFESDDQPKVALEVLPEELAGIIEALHDGVLRRIRWTCYADHDFAGWKGLDIGIVQTVMSAMQNAYVKSVMTYRDADYKNRGSFEAAFLWPDEVFEILDEIMTAQSWDEVPKHPVHDPVSCKVCCTVFGS
jgi:hypothetical protein